MNSQQSNDASLRAHLVKLLTTSEAHLSFDDLLEGFPVERCNETIDDLPYTPWQVLEHLRIAQWDIMEFARNAKYISPDFPEGYWPKETGNKELWEATASRIQADLEELAAMVEDPSTDLFAKIPHGTGQTLLRQVLLTADHNAYHLGTLTLMKRLLQH